MGHEVLSDLRNELGDVDFLRAIRIYVDEHMDEFDISDNLSLVGVVSAINDALLEDESFEEDED